MYYVTKPIKFLVIFTCLMLLITTNCNSVILNKLIILIGPSRSGKSCFINTITAKYLTVVGDDSGESTTKHSMIFVSAIDGFPEKDPFILIDTIGLDDSEESEYADPANLANQILALEKITQTKNIDVGAILVFESLKSDKNKLNNTLEKIKSVFGDQINENIIVVLNKKPKPHPKRLERLQNIIKNHKVKYIHWKSPCSNRLISENYYDQIKELHQLILNIEPLPRGKLSKIILYLIKEGREILNKINCEKKETVNKWLGKYVFIVSAGLLASNVFCLPSFLLANVASELFSHFNKCDKQNENVLILLAIEERFKETFRKTDL
jgi:GTPase SAR1 family protein